jgi:hypothetical protein
MIYVTTYQSLVFMTYKIVGKVAKCKKGNVQHCFGRVFETACGAAWFFLIKKKIEKKFGKKIRKKK